jgi:hypothetical protein
MKSWYELGLHQSRKKNKKIVEFVWTINITWLEKGTDGHLK